MRTTGASPDGYAWFASDDPYACSGNGPKVWPNTAAALRRIRTGFPLRPRSELNRETHRQQLDTVSSARGKRVEGGGCERGDRGEEKGERRMSPYAHFFPCAPLLPRSGSQPRRGRLNAAASFSRIHWERPARGGKRRRRLRQLCVSSQGRNPGSPIGLCSKSSSTT